MIATKRIVYYTSRAQVTQEAERWGRLWTRAFIVILIGREERGRASRLRLAGLNKSSRLWDIGAAPSCLVSGSGVIRAEG